MEAPSFEDTVALDAPSFDDTTSVESEAPSFEDTQPLEEPAQPLSELSSRALASAAEGALQGLTMVTRIAQATSPLGKVGEFLQEKITGVGNQELITEMEGAASRAKDDYGVDPKFDKGLKSAVASGAGSMLPILASGGLAPFTGAAMAGEQGLQEAEAAGATGAKKYATAASFAATAYFTEKLLGLPAVFKSLKEATKVPANTLKAKVLSVLKESGKGFGREGLQEVTEQVMNDLTAKGLYDPDREVFNWKKLATVGLAGGLVGSAVSGGLRTITAVSPESIAPKTEMQDAAQSVDESLAQMATEVPPTETFIPSEQVPQGPPVIPTGNAVQGPPVTAEEGVPSESSIFVGTSINTPGGPITGEEIGSGHPTMMGEALDKGLPFEEVESNLGFAFKRPDGTTEWVDRVEAGRRLTESGQLVGLKPGEKLTSEHIRNEVEGVTFTAEPQPVTQNAVPNAPSAQILRDVPEQREQSTTEVSIPESPKRVPQGVQSEEEVAQTLQPFFKQAVEVARQAGATDPESAVSEAMVSLGDQVASGKTTLDNPGALLSEVARKNALSQARAEQTQKRGGGQVEQLSEETQGAEIRGPRAAAVSEEAVGQIHEAIKSLPTAQAKVFTAKLANPQKTNAQLAEELGMTEGSVRMAIARGRETLANFIREQGIGERMAPGASNIRELKNARYTLASDIYEGLRQAKQLDRATWEKNVLREYGDIFDQEQLDDAWAIAQEASTRFQEAKGRKPMGVIIDQLTGAPAGEGITSIKNEQADAERRARGLPAAMKAARRAQVGLWDETMRYMEENPQAQAELIAELNRDTRRTVNDRELMMLTHAKIQAENQFEEAVKAVNEASSEQARMEAMQVAREAQAKLINLYDIAKQVGSEQGRAFAARKMLISRDFSVARMSSEIQAAQGGQELSTEQAQTVQNISENIQRTESELDARTSTLEQQQSEKAFNEAVKDFQERLPFDQRILAIANKIVAKLDAAAKNARERIRKRLQNTNALVDPTLIYDLAVIGASKIAHGLRDLAWKNSMREEFGEEINPHLDQVYREADQMIDRLEEELPNEVRTKVRTVVRKEGSQDVLKDTQEKLRTRSENGESLNDMRAMVQKMALALVRSGVTDPTQLLDAMHAIVSPFQPGITRREVMDLVSGYGDFKALDMEKAKVTLRDLKGQFQNVAKLQDIQKKGAVEKTGIERRRPSDEERRLIREVNEAKKKAGVGTLEAYRTRLEHSIADLQDRINRKDFRKRTPQPLDVSKDPEAVRLAAENAKWKKKFEIEKIKAQRELETNFQKSVRLGKEVLNIPRAVKSSLDFSAVLRQGGFISFGNPARAVKNLIPMFKSAVSEEQFNRSEAEIRSRPNSDLYKRSKLYLADIDGSLDSREEAFRADLADRIPILGKLIRGSNRAYVSFLNRIRADSFDALTANLPFTPTPEQLKAISHYINVSTGRGDLGVHGSAAETLSTVLWSPRLLISRIQLLAAEPLLRGDAKGVRKVIAKEYAKSLTGAAVVLALGILAGADVEKDPRSSDFGKMRSGDTRIDPWMGLQQISVLGSRLATREAKTQEGRVYSLMKSKKDQRQYNDPTSGSVFWRFIRTKMTPLLGSAFDLLEGENVVGDPAPLVEKKDRFPFVGGVAPELLVPLSVSDILPIMEANGIPKGTAIQLLNLFGASVQHYQAKASSK